jgi:hypothetical protein
MDEVAGDQFSLTFNGPLEAGVRAVAVLGSAFPRGYDIQRLTAFDYLLVRTHQLGGPDDLHPTTPIRTPATEDHDEDDEADEPVDVEDPNFLSPFQVSDDDLPF